MTPLKFEVLSEKVGQFVADRRPVLFSGAGVGKRVGFPLWKEYLEQLASVCRTFGADLAGALMEKRVSQGDFLGAAAIYETCLEIPEGERWKELARPFHATLDAPTLQKLRPLLELPLGAIVTTNYDRSQHDAYASVHQRSPLPLELDDRSLRGGGLQSSFYIARIHGRAEQPTSIVLYPDSYRRTSEDSIYRDFLTTLLSERPCIFIGFSFVDPAIRQVFELYESVAGPVFKVLHLALLPDDSSPDLRKLLHRLNIEAVTYDSAGEHDHLWKALRKCAAALTGHTPVSIRSTVASSAQAKYSALHRCFAFTYAQQRSSRDLRPLSEQARDGVVLSLLRERGGKSESEGALLTAVRTCLQLSEEEAKRVLRDSLARLLSDGLVHKDGDGYTAEGTDLSLLSQHLETLVIGVLNRLRVQEGVIETGTLRPIIYQVLERLFVLRAWDVAAHYAGGGAGFAQDIGVVMRQVIADCAPHTADSLIAAIQRSCLDLLIAPSDREANPLAEIGRTAFALQMVFSSPRQVLLQRASLPQRVYLDASFLLPALVDGHPLRPVYRDALKRIQAAAREAGIGCELIVGRPFLNEVISHREIALRIVTEQSLNNASRLRRMVILYRAENLNVFVGAYASHVAQAERKNERKPTFREFLSRIAPYSDEGALELHLKRLGIHVLTMDFRRKHNREFVRTFNPLVQSYESLDRGAIPKKEKVLIEHEAMQLTQLGMDAENGARSIFVSADRRLQRALLCGQGLRSHVGAVVSPEGFVGLVDVMVGLKADRRALARLIWSAPRRDTETAIRDYLVRKGLSEMDAALAKAMPEVIGGVLAKAKLDAEAHSIDFGSANDPDDVARTARFMDRLDDDFFETMRWWVEKESKQ